MNSLWLDSEKKQYDFEELKNDFEADVCIVGAGIFGMTTAYYLSKAGLKVAVIDKNNICQRTTALTTGKITSQHGLIYDYLFNSFGKDFAYNYLTANEQAIKNIEKIVAEENIDCDFEKMSNYIYTTQESEVSNFKNEYSTLKKLDCDCEYTKTSPLPFQIKAAIEFKNQAQFNSVKYVYGLIPSILKNGGIFFINSEVVDIKKQKDFFVSYSRNGTIKSKYLVLASHYPFVNFPGLYFLKMYQSTSYTIALETEKELFDGMFVNEKDPIFSFRTALFNGNRLLIISGASHKTGENEDVVSRYKILENKAYELYPDSKILFKWSNKDCITLDKVPYIGDFSEYYKNMYIATGFNKWGMTLSNVAANIISDKILNKENQFENTFLSTRLAPVKNRTELKSMVVQASKGLALDKLKVHKKDLSDLGLDKCKVFKVDGEIFGVYKDSSGNTFAVNPICTHLGCLLSWNNTDKTWDCPCHGSRFDFKGNCISDPAFKNLNVVDFNSVISK